MELTFHKGATMNIKNFALSSPTAKRLYESYAKDAPIYDYHCHLNAQDILDDKQFESITQLWLAHDHYKWRAMRYRGLSESLVSGQTDDESKFKAYIETIERLVGSPLYHWSHLELQSVFGINDWLQSSLSSKVFNHCNEVIATNQLSPRKLIKQFNVKFIGTTDDPIDSLSAHKKLQDEGYEVAVRPTFRPDKVFKVFDPHYLDYIDSLSVASQIKIVDLDSLKSALITRIEHFSNHGCRFSDHSIESLQKIQYDENEAELIFNKIINKQSITELQAHTLMMNLLAFLAKQYHEQGWIMQLHIGAYRNVNQIAYQTLGVDTGFDMMNDFRVVEPLVAFLNECEISHSLPKTILYPLNVNDFQTFSTLPHAFCEAGVIGKVQFGAPWWFNDHLDGFKTHFTQCGNQGLLADHIGMLTDSRSFLSYVRHDYYRRALCDHIGQLVDNGQFSNDESVLKSIIEGIAYKNIQHYIGGL
jgi:glucuronate isomerase